MQINEWGNKKLIESGEKVKIEKGNSVKYSHNIINNE